MVWHRAVRRRTVDRRRRWVVLWPAAAARRAFFIGGGGVALCMHGRRLRRRRRPDKRALKQRTRCMDRRFFLVLQRSAASLVISARPSNGGHLIRIFIIFIVPFLHSWTATWESAADHDVQNGAWIGGSTHNSSYRSRFYDLQVFLLSANHSFLEPPPSRNRRSYVRRCIFFGFTGDQTDHLCNLRYLLLSTSQFSHSWWTGCC